MSDTTQKWFHFLLDRGDIKYRLILFPHAGASATFFHSWAEKISSCEICIVKYPGRADRIEESLPDDLKKLGKDVAHAALHLVKIPTLLFGHSMGAPIALETARELEKNDFPIIHLIASGSRNGLCPKKENYTLESDEELCQQLVEMGGTTQEMVDDPIFRDIALPPVRADGMMFHSYETDNNPQLKCSISTICGDVDLHHDIRPWKSLTRGNFKEYEVSGDHFYLIKYPPFEILHEIMRK